MTNFLDMPDDDLAELSVTLVIPRTSLRDLAGWDTRGSDKVREIVQEMGVEPHYVSTRTRLGVSPEIVSGASRARNFQRYMEDSADALTPLIEHVGGDLTQTGGGCLAVELGAEDGYQILVTDEDGPLELPGNGPPLKNRYYAVGLYDPEDRWATFGRVAWDLLPEVTEWMQRFSTLRPSLDDDSFEDFGEASAVLTQRGHFFPQEERDE